MLLGYHPVQFGEAAMVVNHFPADSAAQIEGTSGKGAANTGIAPVTGFASGL